MTPAEVAANRCPRTFCFLLDGSVRVTWACGSTRTVRDEVAVDVEILDDHIDRYHHHHMHLPQHHRHHQGAVR